MTTKLNKTLCVLCRMDDYKSPNDPKHYRLFTLPNQLQVLLIQSDSSALQKHDNDSDDSSDDSDQDMEHDTSDSECHFERQRKSSVISRDEGDSDEYFDMEDEEPQKSTARRAGACLTVGVGSFAEPPNLLGLAHYLEHMLFMGK